ncbi:MAG: hypothetical protein AAF409_14405 [Pseudomonadota bacterium]
MSRIVIIADPQLAAPWAESLTRDGHAVLTIEGGIGVQTLFDEDPFEIVIVEIDKPDAGESMLVPQVRATWPNCKVIAVVTDFGFRRSAVFEMGLWTPDQVLIKPLAPRLLRATVSFLSAQIRSKELREFVNNDVAQFQRHLDAFRARRRDESGSAEIINLQPQNL